MPRSSSPTIAAASDAGSGGLAIIAAVLTCTWQSISPGMTVVPVASITSAPSAWIPRLDTSVISAPSTRMSAASTAPVRTSRTSAPRITVGVLERVLSEVSWMNSPSGSSEGIEAYAGGKLGGACSTLHGRAALPDGAQPAARAVSER